MLTPAYLMDIPEQLVGLWSQLEQDIVGDIARRLVKTNTITASAGWQIQKMRDMLAMQQDIATEVARMSSRSQKEVARLVTKACEDALKYDDAIYDAMGLTPTPIAASLALREVIQAGIRKTNGLMRNFTNTTANTANRAFENALDRAYMQVQSGAFSYETALSRVIKDLGSQGIEKIAYPTGHVDHMDVAARRALLTGLNQTTAELQIARMDEMGCDLVEVTSHAGARPSHAEWQGQVYSRSGRTHGYDSFDVTGYGTGDGLCGWNCYHNFFPYFDGLSTRTFERDPSARLGKSNDQVYAESQQQRGYERSVREAKRECVTLDKARKAAAGNDALQASLDSQYTAAAEKLKRREAKLTQFCTQTGRTKLPERGKVYGFGQSQAAKASSTAKKAAQQKAAQAAAKAAKAAQKAQGASTPLTGYRVIPSEKDIPAWAKNQYKALTPDQIAGVKTYTGYQYTTMNKTLRAGQASTGDAALDAAISNARSALASSKVPEDIVVWRGTHMRNFQQGQQLTQIPVSQWKGRKLDDLGFSSTGIIESAGWSNQVKMKIYVPKGTEGLYVDPISAHQGELELLLKPAQPMRILDATERGGQYTLTVICE